MENVYLLPSNIDLSKAESELMNILDREILDRERVLKHIIGLKNY